MEVTVDRSGGFAGVHERLGPVDTSQLGAGLGAQIEAKVTEIGFFDIPEHLPGGENAFDTFKYKVTVADGERSHSVSYDELSNEAERCGIKDLVQLLDQAGVGWQDAPLDIVGDPGGNDADPSSRPLDCGQWSAWYNRMPPNPDPRLHVTGTCTLPMGGVKLTLEPGNVGVVPERGLFVLELKAEWPEIGPDVITEQTVTWEGETGEEVQRVRIQGAASAEIEVKIVE